MSSGKPNVEDLHDRIVRHQLWRRDDPRVAVLWAGYVSALLEWGLLTLAEFDSLDRLLPRTGGELVFELMLDRPVDPENLARIQEQELAASKNAEFNTQRNS